MSDAVMNPQTGEMIPVSAGERAASAVATQAAAQTQARYTVALARPRSEDAVRAKLLHECRRRSFAEKAKYNKPIGKGVVGPSIRYVEAALRCMGNVLTETATIYDDDSSRIVRVSVTDLESNATYYRDVSLRKTVERRQLKRGQVALSTRVNSYGDTVYIVEGTDDDIANKEGALISKAVRTLGLRLIPGDLVDESMELVDTTLAAGAAKDPDGERKRLVDAFVAVGVQPDDIAQYLGHALSRMAPTELADLRAIYSAIRDSEATWEQFADKGEPEADADPKPKTKSSRTADALAARRAKKEGGQ